MTKFTCHFTRFIGAPLLVFALPVQALDYPIGAPQNRAGMEVGAVYLQAVDREPDGHMNNAPEADIRLEADIHALDSNPSGLPEGLWMPYQLAK